MKSVRLLTVAALSVGLVAVMPAAQAGGGCHYPPGETVTSGRAEGDRTEVSLGKCLFTPTVFYVDEGTEVTWTNRDAIPHTVTGAMLAWGNTDLLERGDSLSYRFESEGVYPYYCVLHPGMAAAVVVGDPDAEGAALAIPPVEAEPPGSEPNTPVQTETTAGSSLPALAWAASGLALLVAAGLVLGRRRRAGEAAPV